MTVTPAVLNETLEESLRATSIAEIERTLLEGTESTVRDAEIIVYRYDREEAVLQPRIATPTVVGLVDRLPSFSSGSGVWRSFVEKQTLVVNDFDDFEAVRKASADPLSAIAVPLADHGVLLVCSSPGTLSEKDAESVEVLARIVQLAVERLLYRKGIDVHVGHTQPKLARTQLWLQVLKDVQQTVLRADTREELITDLCDVLADFSPVSTVTFTPREFFENGDDAWEWAGEASEYVYETYVEPMDASEPTYRAAATQEPKLVKDVATAVEDEPWRKRALANEITQVVSVPLRHQNVFFGVLSVYLSDPIPVEETLREIVSNGSELVGYGLAATEQERTLVTGHGTEIELKIESRNCLNLRLAAAVDTRLVFESVVPDSDGNSVAYVHATHGQLGAVLDLASSSAVVDETTFLTETSTGPLVELVLTEAPLERELVHLGVEPIQVTAATAPIRIVAVARLGPTQRVRAKLAALENTYPNVELLAQRDIRPGTEVTDPQTLLSCLSDRQREIVDEACRRGYFESPRRVDGEDIAEIFNVAPSTFYEHVRAAQRNLFEALFADEIPETRPREG